MGENHRDLGVLDAPCGPGVLALHPDAVLPLLQVAGVVDDEHRLRVGERVAHVAAHVVAHRVSAQVDWLQQVLEPVGGGSPRCSAIVQQYFRSRPESRPSISLAAQAPGQVTWSTILPTCVLSSRSRWAWATSLKGSTRSTIGRT